MIHVIYGKRGSGKTKRMIELANEKATACSGDIVFIHYDGRCMLDLHHNIRYINAGEYQITSPERLYGFICGVLAQDYDIEVMYLDGFTSLAGVAALPELLPVLKNIQDLADKQKIDIYLSISGMEDAPEEIRAFIHQ